MEKYFSKAVMLKCTTIFCLLFVFPILSMFAGMDATHKQYKKQDIERDLKNKKLKNTDISRQKIQASTKTLPVDTDNDGMPDFWESDNSLDSNNPDDAWYDPDGDEVVNLFEYQLGSDLNNSSTPQIVTVAQSGADYADVETAVDSISDGTVIRVAGDIYYVNYTTFNTKVVMIQGGWSSDFSKRNLKAYPTTFDGGMKDEILYFSVSSGEPVIILDGINFIKGNGNFGAVNLLAQGSASMKTSIFNCSVTDSEGGTNSSGGALCLNNWDSSQSDRTIGNTIISGNGTSGIESHITEDAIVRWRIINTTICNNTNSESDSGRGIDVFTLNNGVLNAHIYNSIIWGNKQYDLEFRRNITFEVDHSDIDNVDAGSGAVYQSGDGVVNVDPLFVDSANDNFHLQSSSPVIDAGTEQGVPSIDYEGDSRRSGTTVDMGADEYTAEGTHTTPIPTSTTTPSPIYTPTVTAAITPTPTSSSSYNIGLGGGTIEITDTSSSLYKVKVEIPAGALEQESLITISDVPQEDVESDLDVFFSGSNLQFLKAVHIEMEPDEGFKKPIKIFIPYSEDIENDILIVKGSSDIDLDKNGSPDQLLVDTAKLEDEYVVTSAESPFPGITSTGTFLFLESANEILFSRGEALNSSGEPVEGALVAAVQGSGIFSVSQEDGAFVVNVNKNKKQITTLMAKDTTTGLFGYFRQKGKKQKGKQVKFNDSSDTITIKVDHKLSSKEKKNIKIDWVEDTNSHPFPGIIGLLYNLLKSKIEKWIMQEIDRAPTIPFNPTSATMCLEGKEQRVFTADIGYYKKWGFYINNKKPSIKLKISLGKLLTIIPSEKSDTLISISAEVNTFSINSMIINASIDNENVANIISQKQESNDTNYNVTVEAFGKGEAKLRGAIMKLASTNVGIKFAFSISTSGVKLDYSISKPKGWPFLDNAGLKKIGPADISVGGEIDITNESPTGEISNKRPKISATIKSCNHEIDLSSIQMTLDGSLVEHTVNEDKIEEVKISYAPDYDLDDGEHTVTVNASTADGLEAKEKEWTFSISSQEGGDLCGDFGIDVKYSDNNCSFTTGLWKGYYCPDEDEDMYGSEKRKRVKCYGICANIEYPDKNTIVVSGKGSLRHVKIQKISNVTDATCKISFKLTFKIDERYKSQYKKTCKKNNFYVPIFKKVSGYIDININLDDYNGSKDDGKCTLTDSVHITISESKPISHPISIDCDTEEVIFIGLHNFLYNYKKKYLTESGGSLRIFSFSLGSLFQ